MDHRRTSGVEVGEGEVVGYGREGVRLGKAAGGRMSLENSRQDMYLQSRSNLCR